MENFLDNKKFVIVSACLLAILAFIFFFKLGQRPLSDYDESIYAQVAQESLLQHHPLNLTWMGNLGLYRSQMWFEKPPLMVWLTMLAYETFGINEFAARIWIAVFALATVALTFYFVLKIFQSRAAALLSLACYFIAFQFVNNAGILQFDTPVSFFILAALFCFWQSKKNYYYFYFFWAALGLGVMAKSVIGLLPLPIIGICSLTAHDWHYLKEKNFWIGFILFLVITLPWHVIETVRFGKTFWDQYFSYHLIKRYTTGLEGNQGGFWFYWRTLLAQKALLFLSLPSLAYFLYKIYKKSKPYLLVATSVLFIFLFFSFAQTKLSAYILVIYPFLIILVSVTLSHLFGFFENKSSLIAKSWLWTACGLFLFSGLMYNNYRHAKIQDPYLANSKAIGLYLKNTSPSLPVYAYSTFGTKPAVIFYANQVVYYLRYSDPKPVDKFLLISEVKPNFPNTSSLLLTTGSSLYLIQ